MKLIIDIPDNELKNPLRNIHLLINNGIITEVCIKKYDKDEPYFMDLNYAPLEECGDCISRQAVLAEMYKRKENGDAITAGFIKNLPPVTPTEKVGQWISNAEDDLKISEYTCSNCKDLSDEDSDFCPKCGSYNGGKQHD